MQKKESPEFRFPEVGISVNLSYGELMESEAIYYACSKLLGKDHVL